MTLRELAREGENILEAAGVPDALHDARTLLVETFCITVSEYILYAETDAERVFPTLSKGIAMPLGLYRDRIKMRAARIPLQQILGEASFMGLDFRVNEHTLCPRQDTETLVEAVLAENTDRSLRILDLCTGTGCIGISLSVLGGYEDVTLSDVSGEAFKVAAFNAEKLQKDPQKKITVLESDLFEALSPKKFDIIVSNPPYIRDGEIPSLMPEVKTFEPKIALSGGEDGLSFYRRIIPEAPSFAPKLYLETGFDQTEPVSRLMYESGYRDIKVIKDLSGNGRVVSGHI